jgi:Fur family transcriptional regulator, ferric uptake regulator
MNKQKILQEKGLKTTSARIAVLDLLERKGNPLDVLTIVENLNNQADQATIYRILEVLTDKGIVSRLEFGEGKYRYELQKMTIII